MTWMATPFMARPWSGGARYARSTTVLIETAQSGWTAWTYSKTAKLNAWSWHGLGTDITSKIYAWATLGNSLYLRRSALEPLFVMAPDIFYGSMETNQESVSVYAETQWLDFGKPGSLKALTGMDFDGQNVTRIEIYGSVDGNRQGQIFESIDIGDAQGGWTYSGDVIPVSCAGTEFKLRFVGDPNLEAQVNRLTLYFDDLGNL